MNKDAEQKMRLISPLWSRADRLKYVQYAFDAWEDQTQQSPDDWNPSADEEISLAKFQADEPPESVVPEPPKPKGKVSLSTAIDRLNDLL